MPFMSFFFLPVLPVLCLVELARIGKPSVFPTDYDVSHGLFINGLYCVEEISFIFTLFSFYHEWVLNFVKCFFFLHIEMIMWFKYCILWMCYILHWFVYVKPTFRPRGSWEHHWSWCLIFLIHIWIQCASVIEEFYTYVYQRYWSVVFYSCSVFVQLWYLVRLLSLNEFGCISFNFTFWKSLRSTGVNSYLNISRIQLWIHLVLGFSLWGVFKITIWISLFVTGVLSFSVFCFSLNTLYVSQNLSILSFPICNCSSIVPYDFASLLFRYLL